MAYCVPDDVVALNTARVPGQGSNPTIAQIQTYINMGAGEIDAALINKGYTVPVDVESYPEAGAFLNNVNAHIALHLMERAAPTSRMVEHAASAHTSLMGQLVAADTIMDVPKDESRAEPRGPGVTVAGNVDDRPYDPVRPYGGREHRGRLAPMFTRDMEY